MSNNFKTFLAFVLVIAALSVCFYKYHEKTITETYDMAYSKGYNEGINYDEKTFGHEKPKLVVHDNSVPWSVGSAGRYQWGYLDGYTDGYKQALDDNGIAYDPKLSFETDIQ